MTAYPRQPWFTVLLLLVSLALSAVPARAKVTLGAVPGPDSLVATRSQAMQLARYLQQRLKEEVVLLTFSDAANLDSWLRRNPRFDLAILRLDPVETARGKVFRLGVSAEAGKSRTDRADLVVLQEHLEADLLVRLQEALVGMADDPEGRRLLAASGAVAVLPPGGTVAAFAPQAARPGAPGPAVPPAQKVKAKAAEAKTAQPKAAQPKAAQPKAAQPKAAQPKAAQPKAAQPKAAQPKAAATEPVPAGPSPAPPTPDLRELLREPPPRHVVYVEPFTDVMVPPEVSEVVFDQFVDRLNAAGQKRGYQFRILKEGLSAADRKWLKNQEHVTGEIFGYVEESGCCSTEIRARARLLLYRPEQPVPALDFEYPDRVFFDHDRHSLAQERRKIALQIATALSDRLLEGLEPL